MIPLIEIKNLTRSYGDFKALNNLSLNLYSGHEYVIQGASGSGKSTLLYMLGGLDQGTSGNIFVDKNDLFKLSEEALALYRNKYVGFVFQFHFLLPSMNCLDNMLLPARLSQLSEAEFKNVQEKIVDLSLALGIDHVLKKYPYQISGGEQQRVNIVRALSLSPKLLLCDEPTGNLDSQNSKKVITLIRKLAREFGATLVVVTHDSEIANEFSHRFIMRDGKLVAEHGHD